MARMHTAALHQALVKQTHVYDVFLISVREQCPTDVSEVMWNSLYAFHNTPRNTCTREMLAFSWPMVQATALSLPQPIETSANRDGWGLMPSSRNSRNSLPISSKGFLPSKRCCTKWSRQSYLTPIWYFQNNDFSFWGDQRTLRVKPQVQRQQCGWLQPTLSAGQPSFTTSLLDVQHSNTHHIPRWWPRLQGSSNSRLTTNKVKRNDNKPFSNDIKIT